MSKQHGQKRMWAVNKMDELDALNVTIQRLLRMKQEAGW